MEKAKINDYDHKGRGIIKGQGKVIFIPRVLKDEEVTYKIIKSKKRFNEAELIDIIKPSKFRVPANCPYYSECGSCDLLHMKYEYTVEYKKEKVKNIVKRFLRKKTEIEFIKSENPLNYRNKVTLRLNEYGKGYYKRKSHNIVPIEYCNILKNSINEFLKDIELLGLDYAQVSIRCNYNDELLIIIDTHEEENIDIDRLRKKHKIAGIIFNGDKIYGEDHFIEQIGNLLFKVSYNAFFQINSYINQELFRLLNKHIIENGTVLDLYCGVGTLGISVAQKVKAVYGIEIIPNAICDALINSKMNKLKNVKYLNGDVKEAVNKIQKPIDTIIIDPPRSGIDVSALIQIKRINPKQIIYISCEPMTLTRDLKYILETYKITNFYALDMFAYTNHVESVVILENITKNISD